MTTSGSPASSSLPDGQMTSCRGCGAEIHITATSCPLCGASQRSRGYKNKTIAALLAFVFGGLGVHRFYLGQWWGIFYLLLVWTGISSLIGLLEFIVFLLTAQSRWDERYNEGIPAGPGERSGAAIVVLVVVCAIGGIMIIGILAAIAIPNFIQYKLRAEVAVVINEVKPITGQYEGFLQENGLHPDSNIMLGLSEPYLIQDAHSVEIVDQAVVVVISSTSEFIDGASVIFEPYSENSSISWDCTGGTLEAKYRPSECR